MTAVVALMAKDKGGPRLEVPDPLRPVTNAKFETGSYDEYKD